MGRPKIPFEEKFIPVPESGCWLWTSAHDSDGYGVATGGVRAHRLSWYIHMGQIPKGLLVCHKCDTPPCVNPAHLFLGSAKDNGADMARKGRSIRGEKQNKCRLSEESVRMILASHLPSAELARRLGVTGEAVAFIRKGETWKHVPRPAGYHWEPQPRQRSGTGRFIQEAWR